MTDEEFLALGFEEAREVWLEGDGPKERERLHKIYADRHGMKLSAGGDKTRSIQSRQRKRRHPRRHRLANAGRGSLCCDRWSAGRLSDRMADRPGIGGSQRRVHLHLVWLHRQEAGADR